jgi:small-conductance mechanosensitive channel
MQLTNKLSIFLEGITSIPAEYIKLVTITLISITTIQVIKIISFKIYTRTHREGRDKYLYNKKIGVISNILISAAIIIIWENHIKNFMTLISFISAGFAIALKEIILNFFAGIYIKVSKPFMLEDRIEINDLKGDVVNINALSFDILEIGDRIKGEQSTGRIAHMPNSTVFLYPVKNYVEAFKYIWNEITLKVTLESDILKLKTLLYEIVKKNSIIKEIPVKMKSQVSEASTNYRIYFNNLEPIIYTSIVDDHIELYVRYLVHPKKSRNVEDSIWLAILKAYKSKNVNFNFYKE